MKKRHILYLLTAALLIAASLLAACNGGGATDTTTPTATTPTATTPTATTPTATTPTATTPTATTPSGPGKISAENHATITDTSMCNICHAGAAPLYPNPEDHADYANDSCLDAGCHELP